MPSLNLVKKPPGGFGIKPPSGGLVPIGDTGLWITPDEPADPQDCARYPTSPFCTPFFFTLTPFTLVPSIAVDGCNIGIRLDGSFGFYRVPPVSLVYRNPSDDCKPPPPPQAPPGQGGSVPFPFHNCDRTSRAIVVVPYTRVQIEDYIVPEDQPNPGHYFANFKQTVSVTSIEYPYMGDIGLYTDSNGVVHRQYSAKVNFLITYNFVFNDNWGRAFRNPGDPTSGSGSGDAYHMMDATDSTGMENLSKALILQMSIPQAQERLKDLKNDYLLETSTNNLYRIGYTLTIINRSVVIQCGGKTNKNNPPPPFADNPPPRHCCMSCCPNQGEPDNSLLNLLMQKVDKLSKVVGVDDYPVSLPTSLISRDEGFLGNLIPNFNEDVPSLTRFLAWYVERFDEIMGQWEIPIEVKDSDPSKPGDQPLGVKLPNMAEAIAEMFTLAFQTNLNSEVLLNFAVRTAAETVTDKQQNFITYKLVQSLTEWAGYKQKNIKLKMPTLFSIGKTRYDEILKESDIDVPCVDFDEKFGLGADLIRFREAVAILQANYKRKVDPSGDIKGQILKHLLDTFAAVNKVNPEDDEEDFEKFLKEVEDGFINTPGVTNTTQPYGRPYTERPKIRDLTKIDPPTSP